MNRKILVNFIKDKGSFSIAYFTAFTLIILFFRFSAEGEMEVLYPAAIMAFIYIFLMIIEFFKYYSFNTRISKCLNNSFYSLPASTCEHKEIQSVINGIHDRYAREIGSLKAEQQEYRRFLSQWVHGIKTPVSVIDLILQKSGHENTEAQHVFPKIAEENNKIAHLTESILDIIRLEEFSKDYIPSVIDLVDSVKRVVNRRKNQFIYNNVFPELQCASEAVYVLSDSKWNDLLIDQLVSNAIKYSKADLNSKKVFIGIEQQEHKVSLVIRDQGVGIPAHDLGKVFNPFFTGENGRKYVNSTGIGLYMCSMIAGKLDHKISLDSAVGIGTSVTVVYLTKM